MDFLNPCYRLFAFIRFWLLLFPFFTVCSACTHPFAELNVPSAAPSGDRVMQSGALSAIAEIWYQQPLWSPATSYRVGEASHPGPSDYVVLGCSNPSGLRMKETLAIGQGPGIWTYSETQLSSHTQRSAARVLRAAAREQDRLVRPLFGSPAPLRPRSTWAGSWTGVACVSDFPSKTLQIEWPPEVWESGRVLATQHFIGAHVLTVISIYGLPRGPTWPQAAQLMNDILAFITKTFIFGHTGLVAIQGDFNFSPDELDHFHLWRSMGWLDAQSLAATRWNQSRKPTCKGATERDLLWMSPSLSSLCSQVQVIDYFAEHSTLSVTLELSESLPRYWTWPRPSLIPWDQVQVEEWHEHCSQLSFDEQADSTKFLSAFADHYETSL